MLLQAGEDTKSVRNEITAEFRRVRRACRLFFGSPLQESARCGFVAFRSLTANAALVEILQEDDEQRKSSDTLSGDSISCMVE